MTEAMLRAYFGKPSGPLLVTWGFYSSSAGYDPGQYARSATVIGASRSVSCSENRSHATLSLARKQAIPGRSGAVRTTVTTAWKCPHHLEALDPDPPPSRESPAPRRAESASDGARPFGRQGKGRAEIVTGRYRPSSVSALRPLRERPARVAVQEGAGIVVLLGGFRIACRLTGKETGGCLGLGEAPPRPSIRVGTSTRRFGPGGRTANP